MKITDLKVGDLFYYDATNVTEPTVLIKVKFPDSIYKIIELDIHNLRVISKLYRGKRIDHPAFNITSMTNVFVLCSVHLCNDVIKLIRNNNDKPKTRFSILK